jgi:hypothetical protein
MQGAKTISAKHVIKYISRLPKLESIEQKNAKIAPLRN